MKNRAKKRLEAIAQSRPEDELFYRALLISSAFLSEHPSRGLAWLKVRPGLEGGFARNCAIYLAHTELGLTMTAIGQVLGLERSGIGAAAQAVEDLRDDRDFEALLSSMGVALRQAHAVSARLMPIFAAVQKKYLVGPQAKNEDLSARSPDFSTDTNHRPQRGGQSSPGESLDQIRPATTQSLP